jgi:hypothetical protein
MHCVFAERFSSALVISEGRYGREFQFFACFDPVQTNGISTSHSVMYLSEAADL